MRFWPVLMSVLVAFRSCHGGCNDVPCSRGSYRIGSWNSPMYITGGDSSVKNERHVTDSAPKISDASGTEDRKQDDLDKSDKKRTEFVPPKIQTNTDPASSQQMSKELMSKTKGYSDNLKLNQIPNVTMTANSSPGPMEPASSPPITSDKVESKNSSSRSQEMIKSASNLSELQNKSSAVNSSSQTSSTKYYPNLKTNIKPTELKSSSNQKPQSAPSQMENSKILANKNSEHEKQSDASSSSSGNDNDRNLKQAKRVLSAKDQPKSLKNNPTRKPEMFCDGVPIKPVVKDFKWSAGHHAIDLKADINFMFKDENFWCKIKSIVSRAIEQTLGNKCKVCKDCDDKIDYGSTSPTETNTIKTPATEEMKEN